MQMFRFMLGLAAIASVVFSTSRASAADPAATPKEIYAAAYNSVLSGEKKEVRTIVPGRYGEFVLSLEIDRVVMRPAATPAPSPSTLAVATAAPASKASPANCPCDENCPCPSGSCPCPSPTSARYTSPIQPATYYYLPPQVSGPPIDPFRVASSPTDDGSCPNGVCASGNCGTRAGIFGRRRGR